MTRRLSSAIFLSLLCSTLFFEPRVRAELIEQVVAIVNEKTILESDIQSLSVKLKNKGMVDDLVVENPEAIGKDRKKLIEALINERILDSEVKHQNLEVTVERVEQEIRSIASKNNINRNQLKIALKEQGVDFAEYQDFLKKRLERQSLIDKVVSSKIKISDEEISAYYLAHNTGSGKEIYEYTLAHILFLPKGGDVDAAQKRGNLVLEKLRLGGSFDALASQFSEDPNFATGGILGTFKSGEFLKELEEPVKGLPINGTTQLVKTKTGYHILKLLNKRLVADPQFEKAKDEIRNKLYSNAFKKQFAFWLEQRKQEAYIKIN